MENETETCRRELVIEVPADAVQREVERVTETYRKRARVPGFRPGKTPAAVVRQRFSEDIRHEVLHHLIPEYFDQRVREEKLAPVSGPEISEVEGNPDQGEAVRFRAAFEVLPDFELKDYRGLEIPVEEFEVTEEEVENELKQLQENEAAFEPVEDRPLADGDYGAISMRGVEKDSGRAAVKISSIYCEIGGATTLPEFSENLRGVSPGEERTFDVAYPEDFNDQRMAGHTIEYTVKVEAVKRKQLPELNDDFARDLGEYQSLEEVRADIRRRLHDAKRAQADNDARQRVLDRLVELHTFPLPGSLVDSQAKSRMERTVRQLVQQGVDPSKLELDWGRVQASQREGAERDVRATLLLERIAGRENVEVTDEEFEAEVDQMARQAGRGREGGAAAMRARLTSPEVADKIRNRLRSDKTLDLVYREAKKIAAPAGSLRPPS